MKIEPGGCGRMMRLAICLFALGFVFLGGCRSCPGDKKWGRDLGLSWSRVKWAACRAATDPYTWAPAAGAVLFAAVPSWDREVSDWARREMPIFGSRQAASDGGRITRNIAMAGALGTAMATPSGNWDQWGFNKAKGVAVQTAAALAPQGLVLEMKKATDRVRPNRRDDLSFPSTISSEAAAWSASGRRNVRSMPIPQGYRTAMEATFGAATALTMWSRVENGAHYPSDVLAGAAIGNFLSLFIQDSLLGPSWRDLRFGAAPGRAGMDVGLSYSVAR